MSGELDLVVYHGRRTKQHYLSAQIELEILRTENATLAARVAELEAQSARPVTLTPRQCVSGRECYRKGWDAAIKAAADLAVMSDQTRANLSASIRTLTPPDDCGDCWPLKPEAIRAKCECVCGCDNEGTMRDTGEVLCDHCNGD